MSGPYRTIQDGLREELLRAVGRHRYRLWFRDAEVSRVDEDAVTLAVPTEVHRTWLDYTYGDLLREAAGSVLGEGVAVRLEVSERQGARRAVRERLPATNREWEDLLERRRPPPRLDSYVGEGQDRFPVLLLSQFVHGSSQRSPPAVYLYGESGTGKTHLLAGLAAAVHAHNPADALYLTSRAFTARYVAAVRAGEPAALEAFHQGVLERRLLLVDDLHALASRRGTQRALVRLWERALGTSTRFVFSGDRHPRDLEGFSPQLRSWLMRGVVLRLPRPGPGLLRRILDGRAAAYGVELAEDVAGWILERTGSVEGAVAVLDRWAAASAELRRPLETEWMEEIVPSVAVTARQEIVRRAKEAVSRHYGIPRQLMDQPTKVRSAALPRRVAMYLVYRATALPLGRLGRAFGLRSHSSVSRAIQQIREERERDPTLEHVIDGLLTRM